MQNESVKEEYKVIMQNKTSEKQRKVLWKTKNAM